MVDFSGLLVSIGTWLFAFAEKDEIQRFCTHLGYVSAEDAPRLGSIQPDVDYDPAELRLFQEATNGVSPEVSRFDVLFQPEHSLNGGRPMGGTAFAFVCFSLLCS